MTEENLLYISLLMTVYILHMFPDEIYVWIFCILRPSLILAALVKIFFFAVDAILFTYTD